MNKKIITAAGLLTAGLVAGSFMSIAGANAASTPSANPTAPSFSVEGKEAHGPEGKGPRAPREEVTGALATTLSDLAKAKVADATVEHVVKDDRNGAAYAVLMKKTDGTLVVVHFDANNAILSVDTPPAHGPEGKSKGAPREEVTGALATTLSDLAKAKVADATVEHVVKDERNGAAYAVLMEKTDGTHVVVHFDANNALLSVDTPLAHGPEGKGKGHGPRGGHGDMGGDSSWTPSTTTNP